MTMNNANIDSKSIDRLQDLLSINIDSQKGFQEAAEGAQEPELSSLFTQFSQKRAHNAAELRQMISASGQEPNNSGSESASLHRWWMDAKHAITGKDPQSILNEAERGEDSIKNEYERALRDITDPNAHQLVERQYRNVKEGHDQVKSLRDAYRARNPRG